MQFPYHAIFITGFVLIIYFLLIANSYPRKSKKKSLDRITFRREEIFKEVVNSNNFSIFAALSEIIERYVFMKRSWAGYWNNVNANLRFISAFWFSGWITAVTFFILYVCVKQESVSLFFTKYALTGLKIFGTVFVAYYWNDRSAYYNKWKYLADLYNDYLKSPPYIPHQVYRSTVFSYRNSLKHALAMDIIEMEMWSHRSYRDFLYEILRDALIAEEPSLKTISKDELLRCRICTMSKSQAIDLLARQQEQYIKLEHHAYRESALPDEVRLLLAN